MSSVTGHLSNEVDANDPEFVEELSGNRGDLIGNQPRFAFGKNWSSFSKQVDPDRISQAIASLRSLLQLNPSESRPLEGKRFLDIGSGSGLFSLAAIELGARVISMDIDRDSFECTRQLKRTFEQSRLDSATQTDAFRQTDAPEWDVLHASVLDEAAMVTLAPADIVYSWGVLHHTGEMQRAIDAAAAKVPPGGLLVIAIYNDQGGGSRRWLAIKKTYHRLPSFLRPPFVVLVAGFYEMKFASVRLVRGRNPLPFWDWRAKKSNRGMSAWHDWVDWIGGLPFEVATPEAVIMPLRRRGFVLENIRTVLGGWGCNEYVFRFDRAAKPK